MGRVKEWLMSEQEKTLSAYATGKIDRKEATDQLISWCMPDDQIQQELDHIEEIYLCR